jgi:hypothetical protein
MFRRSVNNFAELIDVMDQRGYSLEQFNKILEQCPNSNTQSKNKTPRATLKVAILVANAQYENWADLITPISDCDILGEILKNMGFIVITLVNVDTIRFKKSIEDISAAIPPQSYGISNELCYFILKSVLIFSFVLFRRTRIRIVRNKVYARNRESLREVYYGKRNIGEFYYQMRF